MNSNAVQLKYCYLVFFRLFSYLLFELSSITLFEINSAFVVVFLQMLMKFFFELFIQLAVDNNWYVVSTGLFKNRRGFQKALATMRGIS